MSVKYCTGVAASWCPVHGDCTCPSDENGDRDMTSEGCPLHSSRSSHAEPDRDEFEDGEGI